MSKNIVWSHDLRVQLYSAVITVMGHPYDVPRGARGKPIGMSKAEYIDTLESIGVAIGVGAGKGGALSNQIAWVTCIPSAKCHQGHWNNRNKNLAAADEASYFTKSTQAITPVNVTMTVVEGELVPEEEPGLFSRAWSSVKGWFS